MPRGTCDIFGCKSSKISKEDKENQCSPSSLFKVCVRSDDFSKKWKEDVIQVVTRYRDPATDQKLRKNIAAGKIYVCEKHYSNDQLLHRKYMKFFYFLLHGKKVLVTSICSSLNCCLPTDFTTRGFSLK